MIDRSYLPFKSAREHQDRGMMKWMGFFLSEHTTSLVEDTRSMELASDLVVEEKFSLLGQLYASQLKADFTIKRDQDIQTLRGLVSFLDSKGIILKLSDSEGYRHMIFSDILAINVIMEEADD